MVAQRCHPRPLMKFVTGEKCFCKRAQRDAKRRLGKESEMTCPFACSIVHISKQS